MPTIRLVPSQLYNAAGATYLTVSNEDNMFTNTDSTTYGTVTNIYASTSSRYVYLRGFNFTSIPSGAKVNSFAVKLKASESGASTSTNYRPRICNGTTTLTGSSNTIGTSVSTIEFTGVTTAWSTIVSYGTNFGIRINARRANSNTQSVIDVYGAEIEVDYSLPATVTSTLSGSGTIDPSGATPVFNGEEYELTITPTNDSDTVTVTNNGTDVTSQLVERTGGTDERTLGTYTLVSGTFNSGSDWFSGRTGHGYDTSDTTASNYYSSSSGTIVVFTYDVGFTLPSSVTITRVYAKVNGHAESTSQSAEYMCAQLISGSTNLSAEYNFKSAGTTSNSTQTVEATTLPTVSQLASMKLQCRLGYYGGAINGATIYVEFTADNKYYTYTYTVSGDATIAVTISGGGGDSSKLYVKLNGSWVEVQTAYKKINGAWVAQSDISSVFAAGVHYIKGN